MKVSCRQVSSSVEGEETMAMSSVLAWPPQLILERCLGSDSGERAINAAVNGFMCPSRSFQSISTSVFLKTFPECHLSVT